MANLHFQGSRAPEHPFYRHHLGMAHYLGWLLAQETKGEGRASGEIGIGVVIISILAYQRTFLCARCPFIFSGKPVIDPPNGEEKNDELR